VESSNNPFAPPVEIVSQPPRRHRAPSGGRGVVVVGLVVTAVAGIAVGAFYIWKHAGSADAPGEVHESKLFNYRFSLPRRDWKPDQEAKLALDANLALSRKEPNAWLAIIAQDYKTRTPRDAELHDEALRRLGKHFQGLEWEKGSNVELGGQTARQLQFVGDVNQVRMSGTVLMLTRHGYGYWFITWAPEERRELVEDGWSDLRQGFAFLNNRDGWSPRRPKQLPVAGVKAAYELTYTEGLWEKQALDGYGENADLALRGDDPTKDKKTGEAGTAATRATVIVLVIPGKVADVKAAATRARDYFLEKQKELYQETKVDVVEDKNGPRDGPADIGASRGWMTRLRVRNADTRELYVELATVALTDGILVIQGECQWERRGYWEQEFAALLSTFQLVTGK
jgi:hypothetical protein